jgi:hypothetical protein
MFNALRGGKVTKRISTMLLGLSTAAFVAVLLLAEATQAFSIYWAAPPDGTIMRANDDGTGVTTVLPRSGPAPYSLALDRAAQKIYFVSASQSTGTMDIDCVNFDGTGLTTLVGGIVAHHPGFIALDIPGGKMYWSTGIVFANETPVAPYARIMRANLDGTGVETIVTATPPVGHPRVVTGFQAVALDVAHGKVYWADYVGGAIMRANLDGSDVEAVFGGFGCANALALDLVHGVAYFSNQCNGIVYRANLDGTGSVAAIAYLYAPSSIAVDQAGGHFYVAQPQAATISRANLDGTGLVTLINSRYPNDVALTPLVSFATFTPKVEITLGPLANDDEFEVKATLTLGTSSDGITPLTEAVTIQVGSFSATIPAGSFKFKPARPNKPAFFKFEGTINGVALEAKITPLEANAFEFKAEGNGVNLTGTVNPVTVGLLFGDDQGSATVTAAFD